MRTKPVSVLLALLMFGMTVPYARADIQGDLAKVRRNYSKKDQLEENVRICERIIASDGASVAQRREAFELLYRTYERLQKGAKAQEAVRRMRGTLADDPPAVRTSILLEAELLRNRMRKPEEAVELLRGYAAAEANPADGRAEAYAKLVQILRDGGQYGAAMEAGAKAVELRGDDEFVTRCLKETQEAAYRGELWDRCAEVLVRLLKPTYTKQMDDRDRTGMRERYGEVLSKGGRHEQAVAAYRGFERDAADPQQAQRWALLTGDAHSAGGDHKAALAAYERVFTEYPGCSFHWYDAQGRIVEELIAKGEYAEALGAARILLDAAWDRTRIVEAVQQMARLLKAVDGNVARANEFIAYQRYGPAGKDGKAGTDDDPKDVLTGTAYPRQPAREEAFAAAREAAGDDVEGAQHRARTFTYSGQPEQALRHYMDAFLRAPARDFQSAGYDLIVIGARAVRGHAVGLEAFFDFVNHGPSGEDGKPGTEDDLKDPFEALLK